MYFLNWLLLTPKKDIMINIDKIVTQVLMPLPIVLFQIICKKWGNIYFHVCYRACFSLKLFFCIADCHFYKNQKQKQWKNNTVSLHEFFFWLRTRFWHNNKVFILWENYNEKTQTANTLSSIGSLFFFF